MGSEDHRQTIFLLQEELKKDLRHEKVLGVDGPRDFLFTKRVVDWILKLDPQASQILVLSAWGHILNRWKLTRYNYPMTTAGYHKWRKAQSRLSADDVEKILRGVGSPDETIRRVRELILKTTFPQDLESRLLEDALCLAFLEIKFESYIPEWDEEKYIRILKGTLKKMTPKAQELALQISYSPAGRDLLKKALFLKTKDQISDRGVHFSN